MPRGETRPRLGPTNSEQLIAGRGLHHDTLQSVNDLAGVLRLKGNYDEAQLLYERALAGRKAVPMA